jgi:hypothetical protein
MNKRRLAKRSQSEVIGVVIIVIILVIAGVFMLTQRLKDKDSQKDTFVDPKLAQSFLNALMNTKTEKNVMVSDIIKDCYSNRNDLCGSTSTSDCCSYAYATMKNAVEATLGEWDKSYRLSVTRGSENQRIEDIFTPGCNKFSEKEQPGFYYIPPPPPIIVRLDICKD